MTRVEPRGVKIRIVGTDCWAEKAIKEMAAVNVGDVIHYGKGPTKETYHVRGRADYWLVVRFKTTSCGVKGWDYKCLSPAWWSVMSGEPHFRVARKRRKRGKCGCCHKKGKLLREVGVLRGTADLLRGTFDPKREDNRPMVETIGVCDKCLSGA